MKRNKPATDRQLALLDAMGVDHDPNITIAEASRLITEAQEDPDSRHIFDVEQ